MVFCVFFLFVFSHPSPLLCAGHWHIVDERTVLTLKELVTDGGSLSGLNLVPRNLVGLTHHQHRANEAGEGGEGRPLRHLEEGQGQRVRAILAKEGHCQGKVVRCNSPRRRFSLAGAMVPRGAVWEQVKLKGKPGPAPTWLCRPLRSFTLCKDDQEQLKGLGRESDTVSLHFRKIFLAAIWPERGVSRVETGRQAAVGQAGGD